MQSVIRIGFDQPHVHVAFYGFFTGPAGAEAFVGVVAAEPFVGVVAAGAFVGVVAAEFVGAAGAAAFAARAARFAWAAIGFCHSCKTSSLARSTGILTIPFPLSTQS
jgi:hypothetical protein